MSIIYSIVCILLLTLITSTIAVEITARVIYSANIHNEQYSPIECYVVWLKPTGETIKSDSFTIEVNEEYLMDENLVSIGSKTEPAEMKELHCGKLALTAPFDGVDAAKTNWEFFVQEDQIISGQQD